MIFDKILKESPSSTKCKYSSGQIVNYISSDSNKMQFTLYNLTQMAFAPIKIGVYLYLISDYPSLLAFSFWYCSYSSITFFKRKGGKWKGNHGKEGLNYESNNRNIELSEVD